MREEKAENKKIRKMLMLTTAVLGAALLAFSSIGFGIWNEYKKSIIDNQKQQMILTAETLGDNLEVLIADYKADINGLCAMASRRADGDGRRDWSVFEDYALAHSFIYDVILEDAAGQVVRSTKGNKITDTYSVSAVDSGINLYQSRLDNGGIYLILKMKTGEGAVSLVIDARAYYQRLISSIRLGTNGYVVVKDSRGIILMHPDEQQWGIQVINGRHKLYPDKDLSSLEEMIDRQNKGEEGVSEYYSYWWTEPGQPLVKKISAYSPARIGQDFLVVSTVIDYNDIYVPIAEGLLKLVMVFLGIVAVVLSLGVYMFSLILQKRRDTEEIAYLTELNRLLEEMHQSEETIAHQQRLQIMGTMTGGIAHEFNNLLTPIMGYADLLMMELPQDSEEYDSASEIYEASVKAKEIIQQISSLSRKNMETAYKNLDASKVMRRALKMVQSVCPSNVRLESDLQFGDAFVLGNETQMNQVILNICVNAIHAIGHKEGRILVKGSTVRREDLEKYGISSMSDTWEQYIKVDIEDNGCGMTKEVLKQMFDPFFTTKKGGKGTGLGLALVEQIIASHKGHIFAESRLGEGSDFLIYLPVNQQEAEPGKEAGGKEEAPELKILLVDDNPKVLKLLEKNFARIKMPAFTSVDLEEARRLLKEQKFDVLAVEQYVNGKSAVDFCMSIQGQYPGLIKIIMVDQVTKELAEARQRKIIDNYIDKPVSDASILKAVRNSRQDF